MAERDAAPEWLRAELVTLAWCWRISRRDGVVIGFTSHDVPLFFDDLLFRPAPGLRPSAVEAGDGLAASTNDVAAALTSDAIAAEDLDAGRWDGAVVTLWLADWTAPDERRLTLAQGELGEVVRRGAAFSAELMGPTSVLDAPVCPATSPTCRAALGDRTCRVDMAPRRHRSEVIAASGRKVTVSGFAATVDLAGGELVWMSGADCGLRTTILAAAGAVLTLADAPQPGAVWPTRVVLTEGCDKRLATCRARFANAANFQGEPFLPGNDLLTRYPGG